MALKVKSEKVITYKRIWVFLFFFILLLIIFALIFSFLLLMGGHTQIDYYISYYIKFASITVILPFIIALTTSIANKTMLMHITPVNSVNIDMLKDFFLNKEGYRIVEEKDGFIEFERNKAFQRFIWLNIDKPTIEVKENEVQITLEKNTESILAPLLVYGKKFDLHPEN